MRVKLKGKVIPASFLKIEGRGHSLKQKTGEREEQIEELIGDQNPGPEAPPRSKRERKEQRKRQGRSDCRRSNGKE